MLSRRISDRLAGHGISCRWAREEARDHPFFGPAVRRQRAQPDFAEVCLAQWCMVVKCVRDTRWVLEGCALQSTARLLFDQDVPTVDVVAYWARFASIVSNADATLVYLIQPDPWQAMNDTIAARGSEWVSKLVDYVERSPVGRAHGLKGVDGMITFWMRYRELCDRFVGTGALPVLTIDVGTPDWRSVEDHTFDALIHR